MQRAGFVKHICCQTHNQLQSHLSFPCSRCLFDCEFTFSFHTRWESTRRQSCAHVDFFPVQTYHVMHICMNVYTREVFTHMHAFPKEVHSLCTKVIHITCISSLSNRPEQGKTAAWATKILHFTFQIHKLHLSKMRSKSDTTTMKLPKQSGLPKLYLAPTDGDLSLQATNSRLDGPYSAWVLMKHATRKTTRTKGLLTVGINLCATI